jgi:hypothetical protein
MTGTKRIRWATSYLRRHHVALFALFFALGGTSFAAATALLPANSVGTRQVINGSLQTADLSKTARTALKGNRGANGSPGAPGAAGAPGPQGAPGQAATKLFIAMAADGTVVRNSGVTLADRVDAGVYRISFDADITNCVYLGTAGQDGGLLSEDYHLYTSRTGAHTVNVQIFDGNDTPFDRSFYLGVFC